MFVYVGKTWSLVSHLAPMLKKNLFFLKKEKVLISQACTKKESNKLNMTLSYFIVHFHLSSSTQIGKSTGVLPCAAEIWQLVFDVQG